MSTTTSLTIDGRNFYGITDTARQLGAIELAGHVYLFAPVCLETAKRASGQSHVAFLRYEKGEIREATEIEASALRMIGLDKIHAHRTGGFGERDVPSDKPSR
jgi:hypothetical protein